MCPAGDNAPDRHFVRIADHDRRVLWVLGMQLHQLAAAHRRLTVYSALTIATDCMRDVAVPRHLLALV